MKLDSHTSVESVGTLILKEVRQTDDGERINTMKLKRFDNGEMQIWIMMGERWCKFKLTSDLSIELKTWLNEKEAAIS